MKNKNLLIELFYDWKVFIMVVFCYIFIHIATTTIGGGWSGFPFHTCSYGSVLGFVSECNFLNIFFNLLIYYFVSIFILILIKRIKR